MQKKTFRTVGGATAVAGTAVAALGIGTIVGALLRDAFGADRASDDGPDDLLAPADHHESGRHRVTTPDGTTLNVVHYGTDDPEDPDADIVVAVHGWTCNTAYWTPQINHLAGRRRVVTYDQRGHGLSEMGRGRPSVAMLGQDLDAVLREVIPEGRKAVIVGHSMGGMTIMSWAAQFPDRVADVASSVVLTSTAAQAVVQKNALIPANLPRYTTAFKSVVSKVFVSATVPLPRSQYSARFAQYLALGRAARQAHVDFIDEMIAACAPRVRGRWGSAMGKLDVRAGLHALTVPTTVVVGTDDRLTPPLHAEEMAKVLRDNGSLRDLVIYDGVGHMSSIEAAERFNALLSEILAGESNSSDAAVDQDRLGVQTDAERGVDAVAYIPGEF